MTISAQDNFRISGHIIDSQSKISVPYANISITVEGKLLAGVISDENGNFSLKTYIPENCIINISFMGYNTKSDVLLPSLEKQINLGEIEITQSSTALEKDNMETNRSKQVINLQRQSYVIGDNMAATGGTAVDLMQSVPGITVDMNGSVKLRGSSKIGYLINDKPSALLGAGRTGVLKQVPASSIEKIEIITNPSSKYDPEGMAGIINIVLKEEKREGLNGEIGVTSGAPIYAFFPSISLNYRNNNINIFGSADGVFKEFLHNNKDIERAKTDGTSQRQLYRTIEMVDAKIYRLGADYTFGKKKNNQITAYWQYEDEYETNDGDIKYWNYKTDGTYDFSSITTIKKLEFNYIGDLALEYKHEFAPGNELNSGLIYSYADEEEDYYFDEFDTNNDMEKLTSAPKKAEKTQLSNINRTIDIYADYSKQIRTTGKLEAGYRSVLRTIDLNHLWYNTQNDITILIPENT